MKRKAFFLVLILIGVIIFFVYQIFTLGNKSLAQLRINTNPASSVFLNDKLFGKTPYDSKHVPGEYILKLIPSDSSEQSSWQGKIKLNSSVLTYVNKDLGTSELTTSGEVISLEKISGTNTEISVNSQPEGASIIIDGIDRGTSPFSMQSIDTGEHDIAASLTGFHSRSTRIDIKPGYRLIVLFQLALNNNDSMVSSPSATPAETNKKTVKQGDPKDLQRPYVQIKETPTGFLRVRSDPSTTADEVTQVKPGDKFSLIEDKEGWYKISYESGKEGWISGRYAEKFD